MGNALGSQRTEDLRSYLVDSPDIVVHSLLATYKLFKVFHCAHEGFSHGGVIVKLFIANDPDDEDPQSEPSIRVESLLKPYRDATFLIQCRFSGLVHPNVVPYESAEISSKSALLMRQYFGRNLFDRAYSQPRLTPMHQKWFAFQLLSAVAQLHSVGLIHGDIKSENVFVVSSFHLLLTDLSTFIKPVYLPLNDPVAATSLFFESGVKRRRCFIAPERFIDSLTSRVLDEHGRRMTFFDKEFTTEFARMDIFSLGLTLAELFLGGQHILDLPELLAFRKNDPSGQSQLDSSLAEIPDTPSRTLIQDMVKRNPSQRPESVMACLTQFLSFCPSSFTSLLLPLNCLIGHPIYAHADMRMMLFRHNWLHIRNACAGAGIDPVEEIDAITELEIFEHAISQVPTSIARSLPSLLSWSKTGRFPHPTLSVTAGTSFSESMFSYWRDGCSAHLGGSGDKAREVAFEHVNGMYNHLFTHRDDVGSVDTSIVRPMLTGDSSVTPLIASILGSTAAACTWTRSKCIYLSMLVQLAQNASDECIADYMIPYVYEMIVNHHLDSALRERACVVLAELVSHLSTAETGLFSEYLFPVSLSCSDLPAVVRLANKLAGEAIRLSQPDLGGKKKAAIEMFCQRVLEVAIQRGWSVTVLSNLDMPCPVKDIIKPRLGEFVSHPSPLVRAAFADNIDHVLARCVDPKDTGELLHAILENIYTFDLGVDEVVSFTSTIASLTPVLTRGGGGPLPLPLLEEVVARLLPILTHPYPLVRAEVEKVLVTTIGHLVSPMDQFVFLRHLLPSGCSGLSDLARAGRTQPAIEPVSVKAFRLIVNGVGEKVVSGLLTSPDQLKWVMQIQSFRRDLSRATSSEVSTPTIPTPPAPLTNAEFPTSHSLVVQSVNPGFHIPQASYADAPTIAQLKEWRYVVTDQPPPLPDLGCLSDVDNGFTSLYGQSAAAPATAAASTHPHHASLQGRFLSSLPCVASASSHQHREWRPESLLLATDHDFCSSGLAVPVVAVDATDDGRIIVAAGADSTVRVYRATALESDDTVFAAATCFKVHNSLRMYAMKTVRNTKSVALASDESLGVYRLDSGGAGKGVAPTLQSQKHAFGHVVAMDCFDTDFSSCIVAVCEKGYVLNWDLRMRKLAQTVKIDPIEHSVASSLILAKDATAFAVATFAGHVVLIDNRFLKPVRVWSLSTGPISTMTHAHDPKCVWISSGNEVNLFNLDQGGESQRTYSVNSSGAVSSNPAVLSEHVGDGTVSSSVWDGSLSKHIKSEFNAKCVLDCAGTVLTGHNDGVVRYWNGASADIPAGVAFPHQLKSAPIAVADNVIVQKSLTETETDGENIAGPLCPITEGHRDAINDMCVASLHHDIIVTGGRDGLVKLWK